MKTTVSLSLVILIFLLGGCSQDRSGEDSVATPETVADEKADMTLQGGLSADEIDAIARGVAEELAGTVIPQGLAQTDMVAIVETVVSQVNDTTSPSGLSADEIEAIARNIAEELAEKFTPQGLAQTDVAAIVETVVIKVNDTTSRSGLSADEIHAVARSISERLTEKVRPQGFTQADVEERARELAAEMVKELVAESPNAGLSVSRLERIRDRGRVVCAGRNDLPGFGYLDGSGKNIGFDVDLCRALAAAVLEDPDAIEVRLIPAAERGAVLQSDEVDVLIRHVAWTTYRDAHWGNYAPTMFYDGLGFMVNNDLGVSSAYELVGVRVCVIEGTYLEPYFTDFSAKSNLNIEAVAVEDADAAVVAYENGLCDAYTNLISTLAVIRSGLAFPMAHRILPETISEEPLGPVVPHGDEQWFDIVKAVMGILIYAEAYGVNSSNVSGSFSGDRRVERLLGLADDFGQGKLGLNKAFAQDVIKAVGNYGEIYDRHFGKQGLDIPRENTRNALWSSAPCRDCPKGGQIYAPPLR